MFKHLITALLLFCVSFAYSQNFKGGLFAGAVTSQVDGDGLAGFDMAGFQAGAFTRYNLNTSTLLQLELGFVQKGAKEPPSDTSNFYRMRANYISLPLTLQYRWHNLAFEVGPALDILVTASESDIGGERDLEGTAALRRFSLIGIGGISYYITDKWVVNFRSTISVTPARNASARAGRPFLLQAGGAGQRNVVLSTALYYSFGD
jgi:hypothetical protein